MGQVTALAPLVLGFALLPRFAPDTEYIAIEARLAAYARRSGLRLGVVYVERRHTAPAGYDGLLSTIHRSQVAAVVVPSLADFGEHRDERIAHLEDELGVVVHVIDAGRPDDPCD